MKCFGADHEFEVISSRSAGDPGVSAVVRWCSRCGGVVVDADIDGRTDPGRFAAMRFPATVAAVAKLRAENASLRAQRNTAYGYASDAGVPPWMGGVA